MIQFSGRKTYMHDYRDGELAINGKQGGANLMTFETQLTYELSGTPDRHRVLKLYVRALKLRLKGPIDIEGIEKTIKAGLGRMQWAWVHREAMKQMKKTKEPTT